MVHTLESQNHATCLIEHIMKPTNSKWFVNNYYISKQVRANMNPKSSVKYINIFNDCEFRKQYKQINIL